MKRLLIALGLCVSCSAFADQSAEEKYKELMAGMEVYALGMCDQMMNPLMERRSADGKVAHELVSLSNTLYTVIVVPGNPKPTKHYFTKKPVLRDGTLFKEDVVSYENAMIWSTTGTPPLIQESPNFFSFHFGLKQGDCGLSAPIKKAKEQIQLETEGL